jgi:hypothetical protein
MLARRNTPVDRQCKCKPKERNLKILDRALSRSQAQPSIPPQRSINECILLLKIRESILCSRMKQNCKELGVELVFLSHDINGSS